MHGQGLPQSGQPMYVILAQRPPPSVAEGPHLQRAEASNARLVHCNHVATELLAAVQDNLHTILY